MHLQHENTYIQVLPAIATIILFGMAGGVSSVFLSSENPSTPQIKRALILGVAAAALVPLLLNLGNSSVMKDVLSLHGDWRRGFFTLAGLCIIAASFPKRFIEAMSTRVLDRLEDTERKADEALQVSLDSNVARTGQTELQQKLSSLQLPPDEQLLVKTLKDSPFRYSTAEALAQDSGLPIDRVDKLITALEAQGIVTSLEAGGVRAYAVVRSA